MTEMADNVVALGHNHGPLDVARVRRDFPILAREVHGKPLVYLDSAASAQKPQQVIDAMTGLMTQSYANVHRGIHTLSQESTDAYEDARATLARYLNAASPEEIVFTGGATEAINLVASSFAEAFMEPGDEVVITALEHHANIVPWQMLKHRHGVELKVAPVDDDGVLDLEAFIGLLGPKTKIAAITQMSNALGVRVPLAEMVEAAHARGIPVLVDGCQGAVHDGIDVAALDIDFYVLAGHKLYGPSGIGVLYGKAALLEKLPPYQTGGEMIDEVSFESATFREPPHRFEAGTPPIVEAVGLAAAVDYVEALGRPGIRAHENDLLSYATARLKEIPNLRILGDTPNKGSIVSFVMSDAHANDIGAIIDRLGVAVRVGHHCAQPLLTRMGLNATARASFAVYNTREEVDRLVEAIETAREMLL